MFFVKYSRGRKNTKSENFDVRLRIRKAVNVRDYVSPFGSVYPASVLISFEP